MQDTHKFDPYVDVSFIVLVNLITNEKLDTLLHQADHISFSAAFGKVLLSPVNVPEQTTSLAIAICHEITRTRLPKTDTFEK